MNANKAKRNAIMTDALNYIDEDIIAEVTESLKTPYSHSSDPTPVSRRKGALITIKYFAAVAACALLMSTIIPVIDYVTNNIHSFFPGLFETEDTVTEETAPETLSEETVQTESGLLLRIAADGITYEVFEIGTYSDTHLVIPDSYNGIPITSISSLAFMEADFIERVTLPSTLTNVDRLSFVICENIQYNIYDGVKYLGNDDNPYEYLIDADDNVKNHKAPDGTRVVASRAFMNNSGLTRFTAYYVEHIGDSAFNNCENLEGVIFGKSLIKIGKSAFEHCSKLYNIQLPESLESIGSEAFSGCSSLSKIDIPYKITTIEKSTFGYCKSLKSVTFGNNLVSIEDAAFQECRSLEKVTFPRSLKRIGRLAFKNTAQLHVTIYPGVEEIYADSFNNAGIDYFDVRYIGNAENPYCYALYVSKTAKEVSIHKNTYFIAYDALLSGRNLERVAIERDNERYRSYSNCIIEKESQTLVCGIYPCSIPSGVTTIGYRAFAESDKLKEIKIPHSVKKIESYAFYRCSAITYADIDSGLEEIGDYAFAECTMLDDVIFFDSVKKIGESCFDKCESLTKVYLGKSLEYMGKGAFERTGIESIVLPATLTDIPENAFSSCSALKEVSIMGKDVTIGRYAFGGCSALSSINLENVTNIESIAFSSCRELKEVVLSDNLVHIGNDAFLACGFTEIIIPDGVKSIGDDVFKFSKLVKTPEIPDSVEKFGDKVYYSCDYLISASIPKIKTRLVSSELADCHSLKEVYLHSDIEYIEDGAFYYSKALEKIYYDGTVAEWEAIEKEELWYRCTSGIKVICTDGTLDMPENWIEYDSLFD